MTDLWKKTKYVTPIDFIIDAPILEYDIAKANISVLLDKGIISEEFYSRLLVMPKIQREVIIGNYQRKDGVSVALKQGITEARKSLFEFLGLNETNVLGINNDSVILIKNGIIDFPQSIQVSPHVFFRVTGEYRSYYKLKKKQYFYNYNPITNSEKLEVKGLSDTTSGIHEGHFLGWLMYVFGLAVTNGCNAALNECRNFYDAYIHYTLPIEYYRRIDNNSNFDLRNVFSQFATYSVQYPSAGYAEDLIDGGYNASIINTLATYYLKMII